MDEILKNLPWNKKMEILRIAKGWTQVEAAEKCGTNQKGYWEWEKGIRFPRLNSRRAIARAFGISLDELFPKEQDAM